MTFERTFPKRIETLEEVFAFLNAALAHLPTGRRVNYALTFAVEEFFTNCVKYNRRSAHDIIVRVHDTAETVTVQILDHDVDPFDVTRVALPDLDAPPDLRRVGGLGIHLSRELLDDLAYEHVEGTSIITMTMKLKE